MHQEISKQFIVFSVSKLDLAQTRAFSSDDIANLSDEEMQRIAEMVREHFDFIESEFADVVYEMTTRLFAEKGQDDQTTETE